VLQQERTAFAVAVGVDPALAADDYTYFQITYYSTIEQAIRSGISQIYFGRGAYDAKVRRGCSLSDTWLYSRVRGTPRLAVGGWYRLSSAWNHRKLPAHVRKALA
jgi:hypothetical protein